MNPKIKAFLVGGAEAAGAGAVIGLLSVWGEPSDVLLTRAGLVVAAATGVKFGVVYLLGYLRKNVAFQAK